MTVESFLFRGTGEYSDVQCRDDRQVSKKKHALYQKYREKKPKLREVSEAMLT